MATSPKIEYLEWGEVQVANERFKDVKIWPGGARAWDWNETGTSHDPGIQPADVRELVENGAEVVVLSTGQEEKLGITDEVVEYLRDQGVDVIALPTIQAKERYNELAEAGKPVGALIHSTC